jgi:hypothetical protein
MGGLLWVLGARLLEQGCQPKLFNLTVGNSKNSQNIEFWAFLTKTEEKYPKFGKIPKFLPYFGSQKYIFGIDHPFLVQQSSKNNPKSAIYLNMLWDYSK